MNSVRWRPPRAGARTGFETCPECDKPVRRHSRRRQILGPAFFRVAQLQDLSAPERSLVEVRASFCCDDCWRTHKVREALKR